MCAFKDLVVLTTFSQLGRGQRIPDMVVLEAVGDAPEDEDGQQPGEGVGGLALALRLFGDLLPLVLVLVRLVLLGAITNIPGLMLAGAVGAAKIGRGTDLDGGGADLVRGGFCARW
jgi:hypothetical protein